MRKTVFFLMILTILSKIVGFAREITLSYFYGATNISDAYLVSLTIPTVIFGFVGAALSTSYIPMYSDILKSKGADEANKFTNTVTNVIITLATIIVIIVLAFTAPIVKIFASGFTGETLSLAVTFTRLSVLGLYFTGVGYIYRSYLQLKDIFILPTVLVFCSNIIIILSIIISSKTYIILLAIGSILASAAQVVLLIPALIRKGYRYNLVMDFKDGYLKKIMHQSVPVILGNSVTQINMLVDRTLASQIVVGGISALYYANKLNGFVQGIFVASIATVMYPMLSKMAAENNIEGIKGSLREAIIGSCLLVVPATVGFMVFSGPIVKMLFGRGAFDLQAESLTAYALFYYSVGMTFFGLREVISRAFYSLQDTKTPMTNSVISMIMNIVLNVILSRFMGIGGLALATSISAIICTALLFVSLRKKIGPFGLKYMLKAFGKIFVTSLIMGVIAKLVYNILCGSFDNSISLLAAICAGTLVYAVVIYFMRIEDVDSIVNSIKKKLKRSSV